MDSIALNSPSSLVLALLRLDGIPLILLKKGTMKTSYSVAGRRSDRVWERVTPPEMVTTSKALKGEGGQFNRQPIHVHFMFTHAREVALDLWKNIENSE